MSNTYLFALTDGGGTVDRGTVDRGALGCGALGCGALGCGTVAGRQGCADGRG
ncbi:hypothetical protein MXD63_03390 [Frankia sp. Cpl3]|uniref:hypothetical protein n=1 Tax=Parafrankia colletiae TaxID=573497 RepID=UPI0012FFB116|nr:hypothetical protein [Parafrankia colletiae]MCK9899124.1 hypothetical protein [Frankia sp. Cpl3]